MILETLIVLLYLIIGLWLFVATVENMGGLKAIPEYNNVYILVIGLILVMIFWPVLIIEGFVKRR